MEHPPDSPQSIRRNLSAAYFNMLKVDAAVDDEVLDRFTAGLARLLAHASPADGGIISIPKPTAHDTLLCYMNVFQGATETETAWNALRLCNVGASHRQRRAALECIGLVVLMSVGRDLALRHCNDQPIGELLRSHPSKSIGELLATAPPASGSSHAFEALHGEALLESVHCMLERELDVSSKTLQQLRWHCDSSRGPAAVPNGSSSPQAGMLGAHFEGLAPYITEAAAGLAEFPHLLAGLLDATCRRMM